MKILFIGDVYGDVGTNYIRQNLWNVRKKYGADMAIVNGENASEGNGILPASAEALFSAGADVISGGNHSLQRREIYPYIDEHEYMLRPANYPADVPGAGLCVYSTAVGNVAVICLSGIAFMEYLTSPFDIAERLIERAHERASIVIVDYHAESTSEKRAFAEFIKGRVSAVIGTHTHVQTADEQILECGTAFITDAGMTGAVNSAIGANLEDIIKRFTTHLPVRARSATGEAHMWGVLLDVDEKSGICNSIMRIKE